MSTSDGFVYSLHDPILDRFCLHILPEIHQKLKWLEFELESMERILLATNHPNLYGISLYNMQAKTAIDLFIDFVFILAHEMTVDDVKRVYEVFLDGVRSRDNLREHEEYFMFNDLISEQQKIETTTEI